MKKTIAMYDVTGIQEFIFASSKVKENIGASILVQKAFEELPGEVVYSGGGNAMVIYQDSNTAVDAIKKLSLKMLNQTGGTLKFAAAYKETECKDFLTDKDELIKELKINKYKMVHQTPLLGIGITRQGSTDELPASVEINENNTHEYLSKSAHIKRQIFDKSRYFDDLLPNTEDYRFPPEFDDLGQKTGENYIAVVHIDGNSTGKILDSLLTGTDFQESIKTIRDFSKKLDEKYKSVMKKVIQSLSNWLKLKDKDFFDKLKPVYNDNQYFLPIRPIVLNGDDVTFVCNGKIGIALAEEFLTEFHKESEMNINGKQIRLSACAGVAIVKSHFPFYRAYQLAEELCTSAKMKAKTLAKIKDVEAIGNWLDFHIVQSGVTAGLKEIRGKFYQIPGMKPPNALKYPEYAETPEISFKQYNLLWRPWCIAGNCDEKYQWGAFQNIYTEFTREKKKTQDEILWKRSRLKKLENQMTQSAKDAEAHIRECKSRGLKMPGFADSSDLFRDGQTPYFDALELSDFYVQILKIEETAP